jgi:methyltransferase (TIGR00027 family)
MNEDARSRLKLEKSMREASPSRTALRVAVRRAAHQVLDHPTVFNDPLALAVIGPELAAQVTSGETQSAYPTLRAFLAVRSRFAEDELAGAVARGVRQYVILGAGLDTFAYRNPYGDLRLRVFEVDHPATQAWKRDQLASVGIATPPNLTFVTADFERQTLGDALKSADFPAGEKTFFSWLGVTPYLSRAAFNHTMQFIASMPRESGVVFDYAIAAGSLSPEELAARDHLARRVALAGEPFQLFFEPEELAGALRAMGFRHLEDLAPSELNLRYFSNRADGLHLRGGLGHLMSAWI